MCLRRQVSDTAHSSGPLPEASDRPCTCFSARKAAAAGSPAGRRFNPDGPSTSSPVITPGSSLHPSAGVSSRRRRAPASRLGPGIATPHDSFQLPLVQEILSARGEFSTFFTSRRMKDNPLATVYRIYVALVSGRTLSLRDEIEYFWNKPRWGVADIPEPNIADRQQRAVLAAITYLLVEAFNRLIKQGKPRNAPAIMSDKAMRKLESKPKVLERAPKWAELVEPLTETLVIPDSKGAAPNNIEDADVDRQMRKKNILTFTLPVFFA